MRGGIFLALFFSCGAFGETKRFFCNFHLIERDSNGAFLRAGAEGSDYWDRAFYYKKSGDSIEARFPLQTDPPFEMRQKGDILYGFFQTFAGERQGLYRETHTVYRLSQKTGLLIKSYVIYAAKESFESHFQPSVDENPYAIPYAPEPLEFIDKDVPEGFMKFGRDGSAWRCRGVFSPMYLLYLSREALFQILGA